MTDKELEKDRAEFERLGEARVRGLLAGGQTLKKESFKGERAVQWLEEKRLERELAALQAARESAAANQKSAAANWRTALWTLLIALFTCGLIVVALAQWWFTSGGK